MTRCARGKALAAASAVLLACTGPAAGEGDPARGKALAGEHCARCHAIVPGATSPEPGIPGFAQMAADPEQTRASLRQFIRLPHFEMPPQTLTGAELDDVIAYILSLRR
jgi:mono/diheme cytochrome c family protein